MKKSLRFASAALALTLAAGCAMPAFAAGKSSFSKSETVYAVMNGDGSIKSTTVSEHLYSASGLANVTDKTTLTDIQNTESDAEFTQNGEELVWNTSDTDVYYKGNTDKALPIDVKVTYALDGQEAAQQSLEHCSQSILTSGLTFFAATVGVAAISKMELLKSICLLISRGALISMVVILVMLPAALMLCDWIIRHTTLKWMVPESANAKKSEKE